MYGARLYLPPEIVLNKEHNEKADSWCLGVIVYLLFTGKLPFAGDTTE